MPADRRLSSRPRGGSASPSSTPGPSSATSKASAPPASRTLRVHRPRRRAGSRCPAARRAPAAPRPAPRCSPGRSGGTSTRSVPAAAPPAPGARCRSTSRVSSSTSSGVPSRRGSRAQRQQVLDRALQPVGGVDGRPDGGPQVGAGASSAVSRPSRSPVSGVRSWCEASAENARSRLTSAPSRAAVVFSELPGRVDLRDAARLAVAHAEVAAAELLRGARQGLQRCGQPAGLAAGHQPGRADRRGRPARA